jgi:hypothetical protein
VLLEALPTATDPFTTPREPKDGEIGTAFPTASHLAGGPHQGGLLRDSQGSSRISF